MNLDRNNKFSHRMLSNQSMDNFELYSVNRKNTVKLKDLEANSVKRLISENEEDYISSKVGS